MTYRSVGINRHKVLNGLAQEDPTYENYLRLAECIFTGKIRLNDLLDEEESRKRMKEIDELRARGEKTEYEIETHQNKKYYGTETRKVTNRKIILEVTDKKTGEKTIYKSMREFCIVTNASRSYVKKLFENAQSDKITYKRLIIQKIETESLETEIEPYRIYLNPQLDINKHKTVWNDYEKAFVVQNRPKMKWREIGTFLGRSGESCSNIFRKIKKEGQLEYYRNLDISDKLEMGA